VLRRTPDTPAALRPLERRRLQYLSLGRRLMVVLGAFLAGDLLAAFVVGYRDFLAPAAVFALWIGVLFVLEAVVRLVRAGRGLERLFLGTFLLHTLFAIAVHWSIGGGWWLGTVYLGVLLIVAVTMLEPTGAVIVTAWASAWWAALLWGQALGLVSARPWFGMPVLTGNLGVTFTQTLFGTLGLMALVILQRTQVRSVRRSEESWRLLVDTAPDMIFTLDAEGGILTVNDTVVRETGYHRSQLEGRRYVEFVDRDAELVEDRLARVREGEAGRFEHRYVRADASIGWLEVSAAPVHEDGGLVGVLFTARDVTDEKAAALERERLQQELAQAQRMQTVGRLVSGVAHELNNPLTGILAFTEQLIEDAADPEQRQMLQMVHAQALRSRDIVRDLLAVVRKREGRTAEVVAWREVVEGMASMLRAEVERLGANLRLERIPDDARVHADRSGLEQVLTNLVLNAAQACGKGGTVTVRAVVGHDGVCQLIVEDDGPGIPADVLPRVFEPFFTTKPQGEGTGLGLSVSLGIVEQAGGVLRCHNRPPADGGGARFIISLAQVDPLLEEQAARLVTAGASAEATAPVVRHTALVVDDEAVIRMALRRYFTRRGWEVVEASDGDAALAALGEGRVRPSIIVCDLRMPGAGGAELHAWLSAHADHLLPRLIISTGDVASPDAASFLETARCTVLEKPFDLAKLTEVVDALVAAAPPLEPAA
jgi:PAS domain S-box-containing protein